MPHSLHARMKRLLRRPRPEIFEMRAIAAKDGTKGMHGEAAKVGGFVAAWAAH